MMGWRIAGLFALCGLAAGVVMAAMWQYRECRDHGFTARYCVMQSIR